MKIISYAVNTQKVCISEVGLKPRFRFFFKNLKEIKEKLPRLLKITLETEVFTNKEAELILKNCKSVRDYTKKINAILEVYNF